MQRSPVTRLRARNAVRSSTRAATCDSPPAALVVHGDIEGGSAKEPLQKKRKRGEPTAKPVVVVGVEKENSCPNTIVLPRPRRRQYNADEIAAVFRAHRGPLAPIIKKMRDDDLVPVKNSMLYRIATAARSGRKVRPFGEVGRPVLLPVSVLATVLDQESSDGKTISQSQVRAHLQRAAQEQESARGNSIIGVKPVNERTVLTYMEALQGIGFGKDTGQSSIYKTSSREASERSLRNTACYISVVLATHHVPSPGEVGENSSEIERLVGPGTFLNPLLVLNVDDMTQFYASVDQRTVSLSPSRI